MGEPGKDAVRHLARRLPVRKASARRFSRGATDPGFEGALLVSQGHDPLVTPTWAELEIFALAIRPQRVIIAVDAPGRGRTRGGGAHAGRLHPRRATSTSPSSGTRTSSCSTRGPFGGVGSTAIARAAVPLARADAFVFTRAGRTRLRPRRPRRSGGGSPSRRSSGEGSGDPACTTTAARRSGGSALEERRCLAVCGSLAGPKRSRRRSRSLASPSRSSPFAIIHRHLGRDLTGASRRRREAFQARRRIVDGRTPSSSAEHLARGDGSISASGRQAGFFHRLANRRPSRTAARAGDVSPRRP